MTELPTLTREQWLEAHRRAGQRAYGTGIVAAIHGPCPPALGPAPWAGPSLQEADVAVTCDTEVGVDVWIGSTSVTISRATARDMAAALLFAAGNNP